MTPEGLQARAQRLSTLVQSPGWPDLVQILSEINTEAAQQVRDFKGWDKDQKASLFDRMQAVDATCQQVISKVNAFIVAGTSSDMHNVSEAELQQADETRIPGTY